MLNSAKRFSSIILISIDPGRIEDALIPTSCGMSGDIEEAGQDVFSVQEPGVPTKPDFLVSSSV
jgi:hypothetical protein